MFSPKLLLLAVLSASSACAFALSPPPNDPRHGERGAAFERHAVAEGALARLTLVDRQTGQNLPIVWHQGRAYVAGQPGRRYALALQNNSHERVLAVAAVDGVNVVTGQTSSDAPLSSQSGYVFLPGQRYEVAGWRKSDTQIAAFEFTSLSNSYAARTGRPAQVGVIRVALFREQQPIALPQADIAVPPMGRSRGDAASASNAPAAAAAPAAMESKRQAQDSESLGTGHGRREHSAVQHTSFARASSAPSEVLSIYYDSRENLIAQGVLPAPSNYGQLGQHSHAAPPCGQRLQEQGYVPDPPARASRCR